MDTDTSEASSEKETFASELGQARALRRARNARAAILSLRKKLEEHDRARHPLSARLNDANDELQRALVDLGFADEGAELPF